MTEQIAVVGMEAIFGADEGLDVFDRSIFDGIQPSVPSPEDRPQKVRWGAKSRIKEGYLRLLDESEVPSDEILGRKVIEGALQDATSVTEGKALIVVSDRDLSALQEGSHLPRCC